MINHCFKRHRSPTSSSWSNLIERWFKELSDKQLVRTSFDSVEYLIDTIEEWADNWNQNPKPYTWTKPPPRSWPKSDEHDKH